jgi:hypothetical protein
MTQAGPEPDQSARQTWPLVPRQEFNCISWDGEQGDYIFQFSDAPGQALFQIKLVHCLGQRLKALNEIGGVLRCHEIRELLTRAWEVEGGGLAWLRPLIKLMQVGQVTFLEHRSPDPEWYTVLRRIWDDDAIMGREVKPR